MKDPYDILWNCRQMNSEGKSDLDIQWISCYWNSTEWKIKNMGQTSIKALNIYTGISTQLLCTTDKESEQVTYLLYLDVFLLQF